MTLPPHLIRVLKSKRPPMAGTDAEAVRRGTIRFLEDDAAWAAYQKMTKAAARTYGPGLRKLVLQAQREVTVVADGIAGPQFDHLLRETGSYDSVCDALLLSYQNAHKPPSVWYPQVNGLHESVCQDLHQTSGIPGNWAMDFCCPGGVATVASLGGEIVKLSGHNPNTGTWLGNRPNRRGDVFGWSTYIRRADGVEEYITHQGSRVVHLGQHVEPGQIIGTVGWWPGDPGRSHSHAGVTSPHGSADAKRIIREISRAPKVPRL